MRSTIAHTAVSNRNVLDKEPTPADLDRPRLPRPHRSIQVLSHHGSYPDTCNPATASFNRLKYIFNLEKSRKCSQGPGFAYTSTFYSQFFLKTKTYIG